jgi:prephenate dehydrogenase
MAQVRTVAICGFGLIGGSIALAIQKRSKATKIVAIDKQAVIHKARLNRQFKATWSTDIKATIGADIIILSAPLSANEVMLKQLAKLKPENTLILDTGSVKQPIARLAASLKFVNDTTFLPSHPMAGKEVAGFVNAEAGLFTQRIWYYDSETKLSKTNQQCWNWLIRITQAKPVAIASGTHDAIMSEQSHLPQLLSTVLAAQMSPDLLRLAGPGLKTLLRLAGSPYPLWNEIIKENRTNIITSLEMYRDNINQVIKRITADESLDDIFKEANRSYKCLS